MKKFILILTLALLSGTVFAGDITRLGMNQGDLYTALYDLVQATAYHNRSTTGSGITVGTTTSRIGVPNAVIVDIAGVLATRAAGDATFTTGLSPLPVSTACVFTLSTNGTTDYVTQGPIVASTLTPSMPRPQEATAVLGTVKVVTGATGVFTPGTTALNYASATFTFQALSKYAPSLTGL